VDPTPAPRITKRRRVIEASGSSSDGETEASSTKRGEGREAHQRVSKRQRAEFDAVKARGTEILVPRPDVGVEVVEGAADGPWVSKARVRIDDLPEEKRRRMLDVVRKDFDSLRWHSPIFVDRLTAPGYFGVDRAEERLLESAEFAGLETGNSVERRIEGLHRFMAEGLLEPKEMFKKLGGNLKARK
jgi:hypothetical protein